jgi:hypothetical protein
MPKKELHLKLEQAFGNIVDDHKKIECYNYFNDEIKPLLSKNSYVEKENEFLRLRTFTIDMNDVDDKKLSTLLGIALSQE